MGGRGQPLTGLCKGNAFEPRLPLALLPARLSHFSLWIFSFASSPPMSFPQIIIPFVFSVLFCFVLFFLLSRVLPPFPPSHHLMWPAPYIHWPSSWTFPALSTSEHEKPSPVILQGASSRHSHGGCRNHHLKSPCRSTKTSKVLSPPHPDPSSRGTVHTYHTRVLSISVSIQSFFSAFNKHRLCGGGYKSELMFKLGHFLCARRCVRFFLEMSRQMTQGHCLR